MNFVVLLDDIYRIIVEPENLDYFITQTSGATLIVSSPAQEFYIHPVNTSYYIVETE